jgi:hypothetical protein
MPLLSPQQIYETMRRAGFPDDVFVAPGITVAMAMTAIALRESGGVAGAFNNNPDTGDRSYGLLQINCFELGTPEARRLFGIVDEKELLDPDVNAHAGFVLWGGNNRNLEIAWYVNKPAPLTPSQLVYQARYEAHLPAAQAAALASQA